jgi:hypothetical protein
MVRDHLPYLIVDGRIGIIRYLNCLGEYGVKAWIEFKMAGCKNKRQVFLEMVINLMAP